MKTLNKENVKMRKDTNKENLTNEEKEILDEIIQLVGLEDIIEKFGDNIVNINIRV